MVIRQFLLAVLATSMVVGADIKAVHADSDTEIPNYNEAFERANGAERAFEATLTNLDRSESLLGLLNLCGISPGNFGAQYEVFNAKYLGEQSPEYPLSFHFLIAGQDYDGAIYFEDLFFPLNSIAVDIADEPLAIRIHSKNEDTDGFSGGYLANGQQEATYEFNNVAVDKTVFCRNPKQATELLESVIASNLGQLEHDGNEDSSNKYPLNYSVSYKTDGTNTEGMCEYMYEELDTIIDKGFRHYGLEPMRQISEAPNNDVRLTITEYENTDSNAKNDCRFDLSVSASWTQKNLNPLPAKNQNYETGFELVSQGITEVATSFIDHKTQKAD